MLCPYCRIRTATSIVSDELVVTHFCRPCAIQFAKEVCDEAMRDEAGAQIRELEWLFTQPSARQDL